MVAYSTLRELIYLDQVKLPQQSTSGALPATRDAIVGPDVAANPAQGLYINNDNRLAIVQELR
jgi:hypothetical protein